MNSLQDLNNYADDLVTFTDNRAPDVKFSSFDIVDININQVGTSFPAQYPVDIVEIIKPLEADVKYILEFPAVPAVTLSWTALPSGVTLTQVGNTYTISNIHDVSDWNLVKAPTITLDPDFEGYLYYTSSISYQRDTGLKTVSWQVGNFIPTALLSAIATQSTTGTKSRDLRADLTAAFSFAAEVARVNISPAVFSSSFTQTATARKTARTSASFSLITSQTASAIEIPNFGNTDATRTYDGNWESNPFATNLITYNASQPGTNFTAYVTILRLNDTAAPGILYSQYDTDGNLYDNKVTLTSTNLTTLMTRVQNLEWYPDNATTLNLRYRFEIWVDGIFRHLGIGSLNYSGTMKTPPTTYTLRSRTKFPYDAFALQYYKIGISGFYTYAGITIIGGGGGGAAHIAGGGGGGGGRRIINDYSWNKSKMDAATITSIGVGGTWGGSPGPQGPSGSNGTATVAVYNGVTYTGPGGGGGGPAPDIGKGGSSSANGTAGLGGNGIVIGSNSAGGSGADGSQAGINASNLGGYPLPGSANASRGYGSTTYAPYLPTSEQRAQYRDPAHVSAYPEYTNDPFAYSYGSGGHAGLSNSDGYGNGVDGGIVITYYRY